MSDHLVEAIGLSYAYPDGTTALDGASFRVAPGESVAIVGGNGAGKSTLLLMMAGLLEANAGEVRIGDVSVTPGSRDLVRRTIGFVFQDADDQLFMPTVQEDVAFGPLNLGVSAEEAASLAATALDVVGASHLADRPPYHLSGGEKRAVALAGVIAMGPNVLLLDEPTAGLDPAARRRLIKLLQAFEHTRIVATHDLDLVLDVCTRVLVMEGGRIVADGAPDAVFRDEPLLARCHLEAPLRWQG
ncbi:MAG: ABC transporter ATP-binding protein [Betaproteobacteria bacterium]|nr:ABC transporter ATP-binding protein [Betaproteobacteria bacterium]